MARGEKLDFALSAPKRRKKIGVLVVMDTDVVILGAGAAGILCAITAADRGRSVLVIDHADAPGEKIRISGGGRCNFTNVHSGPKNYISENPHFAKSALSRYTPKDFVALVRRYNIPFHEKALGQLFCDNSARDIIAMLLAEMKRSGARLQLSTEITDIAHDGDGFRVATTKGAFHAASLVVATGGKSIPKMGATGIAYRIAADFGLAVTDTRPALVPLTLDPASLEVFSPLAGVSVDVEARHGKTAFREAMLFTHRGLSGPAILQISSYWREGDEIVIRFEPGTDFLQLLKEARKINGRQQVQTVLQNVLPKRLAQYMAESAGLAAPLADLSDKALGLLIDRLGAFTFKPAGSEGYRTAEVTLGGVSTHELDSRSMMARKVAGLYFIGECVDVTGWLGGYNFQWAWASGHAAGLEA
jgi:hypothetical protein